MRKTSATLVLRSFLTLCLFSIVWMFALPLAVDIAAFLVVALAATRLRARNLALTFASLCVAFAISEAALRLMARSQAILTCYRLDDKYFGQSHYAPNVRDAMTMRFGDITAMDPLSPAGIREKRTVRFVTDDFGFRNDAPYAGQNVVLVGDSFVAGTDTDQADILGNVLRDAYGVDTYSLGFPGNPDDYLGYARRFLDEKSRNIRFVLFLFEGNDLSCSSKQRKKFDPADLSRYSQWKLRFAKAAEDVVLLPKTIFNMSLQLHHLFTPSNADISETHPVGGRPMGFYGPYVDAALFPECSFKFNAPDNAVLSRVAMVFFIPTKYRVYYDFLEHPGGAALPRPASGFASLRRYFEARGIPAYDLTPALTEEAARLLPQGRYVFWRDDTHWNPAGIRAAAAVVARQLSAAPPAAP